MLMVLMKKMVGRKMDDKTTKLDIKSKASFPRGFFFPWERKKK